jgi:RND family efflux transporter MFP subunit
MTRAPRVLVGLVGLALAAAGALLDGCGAPKPADALPPTVRADVVTQIAPDVAERYSVTIQPLREVDLTFKSPGIVDYIDQVTGADGRARNIQEGDRVAAGTELARVRATDYDQRVAQAQAQVAQAQAQVTDLDARLREAQADDDRATHLYQSASLTKPDFDQAEARLHSTTAQRDAARAGLTGAEAALDQATLAKSDASLRAPFAGWVGGRTVEVGGQVGNATPAFNVIDTHLVKAAFAVPDTSLDRVHAGDHVSVWLDAMAGRTTGTVTAVAPGADLRTHVYAVEVTIENPHESIRPGMVGSVVLGTAAPAAPRLVVPLSAVVRDPSRPAGVAVFRLEDRDGKTIAVAQPVVTGDAVGNAIVIATGLRAGERIVSLGGELLHDGDVVRVLR